MNKITRFVQPIRWGHVTYHTSTNLYQSSSSTLFTSTTTGLPLLPHLCPLTTTFTTCQNTATTAETRPPRRHVIVTHQRTRTDHNGSKTRRTRRETEQRARGKGGEHARDKGRGAYKVRLPFHFLKLHLLISPSPKQGPPPPNTKTHPVRVCFGVRRPLPPFRHVAAALTGVCYVSFWPNATDSPKKASPRVWSSSYSHITPSPPPPLQTRCRCPKGRLQRVSFTTRDEHAGFGVSVAFFCVPSRQTRQHVPYGTRFRVCYISSPSEHQRAHLGALVVFDRFSIARHEETSHMGRFFVSGYIPSTSEHPLTYPIGYVSGVRLLVFHPNPSL